MGQKNTHFSNEITRLVLLSIGIALLSAGTYLLLRKPPAPRVSVKKQAVHIAAVTPQSFSMISGQILEINAAEKKFVIDFATVEGTGKTSSKRYTVGVSDTTTLQSVDQRTAPPSTTNISFADLKPGDHVDAIGDTNLAQLSSFTATTIIRLLP